jgi:hypothetical protein
VAGSTLQPPNPHYHQEEGQSVPKSRKGRRDDEQNEPDSRVSGSRENVVGTLTGLRAGWFEARIPAGALENDQTGYGAHTAIFLMGTAILSRG